MFGLLGRQDEGAGGVGSSRADVPRKPAIQASQAAFPEPGDKQGGTGEETGRASDQAHNGSGMQRDPAASSPVSETEAAGGQFSDRRGYWLWSKQAAE